MFDFTASWCGPCRAISPVFAQLAGKFPDVDFYKVDIDAAREIAQEVGIRAVSPCSSFWRFASPC